jgi:hypothetical protein
MRVEPSALIHNGIDDTQALAYEPSNFYHALRQRLIPLLWFLLLSNYCKVEASISVKISDSP